MRAVADFPTERATALMQTMTKHFGHKILTTLSDHDAVLSFEMGQAMLVAHDATLHLVLDADAPAALTQLSGIIESHLLRFAHRDDPAPLVWSHSDEGQPDHAP